MNATSWDRSRRDATTKDKDFVDRVGVKFAEDLTKAIGTLRPVLERRQTFIAVVDEPPLMPANERFLTEPMKSSATRRIMASRLGCIAIGVGPTQPAAHRKGR